MEKSTVVCSADDVAAGIAGVAVASVMAVETTGRLGKYGRWMRMCYERCCCHALLCLHSWAVCNALDHMSKHHFEYYQYMHCMHLSLSFLASLEKRGMAELLQVSMSCIYTSGRISTSVHVQHCIKHLHKPHLLIRGRRRNATVKHAAAYNCILQ